jgi:ATP-dependent RNA helicase RhlE
MNKIYNNKSSRYSGNANRRNQYSRYSSGKNNKRGFEWSETDLIKTVEYSKQVLTIETDAEYIPVNSIDQLNIDSKLKENIKNKNYKYLSHIQDLAIPVILDGNDIIGIANTGTGKTAAFLIPLINKVLNDRTQKALIIAPTRELAEQIYNDYKSLAFGTQVYAALLIGGSGIGKQISDINREPNFIIGTPGRIKDLIQRNVLHLSCVNNVVLDEADRMVDIGFINEIKHIISLLPEKRHSLFFSATVSDKVQEIINSFVKNPVVINVKKAETGANIKQEILKVEKQQEKIEALHDLLIQKTFNKVIVFGNTKWSVQKLSDELIRRGFKADAIHGDKRQNQRRTILEKFKRSEIQILLATDVASRGLDINNVSHVINYEMPKTYNDYVHRIGRTGRADKKGIALTFVSTNF